MRSDAANAVTSPDALPKVASVVSPEKWSDLELCLLT